MFLIRISLLTLNFKFKLMINLAKLHAMKNYLKLKERDNSTRVKHRCLVSN